MASRLSTLMHVLTPQQFRAALLVAIGLGDSQIADFLGTTETTVKRVLREIYQMAGCWNRDILRLQVLAESENELYDKTKLVQIMAEIRLRALDLIHSLPEESPLCA
jgi:DNA-binding CsgD family transcriptional regulator